MPAEIKLSKNVGILEAQPVRSAGALFDHFFHPESVARERTELATDEDDDRLLIKYNIRYHSFGDVGYAGKRKANVVPSPYGFPGVILEAYQKELHLILRPDDIWLAVLTQLNYYINKRQEELRANIVLGMPAERIRLRVEPRLSQRGPVAFGEIEMKALEDELNSLLKDFIKPQARQWLLPKFSTTSRDDRWTMLVTVQGTLSSYFLAPPTGHCGFPSVTLEGRKADWQLLLRCINDMGAAGLGREIEEWSAYLEVVVSNMLTCFSAKFGRTADEEEQMGAFWNAACDVGGTEEEGSVHTLGGWVTAFCWFQPDGARVPHYTPEEVGMLNDRDGDHRKALELGGLPFPVIPGEDSIPEGYARLNMLCEWPTAQAGVSQLKEMDFLAGVVGMEVATKRAAKRGFNVVQPRSGFWMLLTDVDDGKNKEDEMGEGSADVADANMADADTSYADTSFADTSYADTSYADTSYADTADVDTYASTGEAAGNLPMSFDFSDFIDFDESGPSGSATPDSISKLIDPRLADNDAPADDAVPAGGAVPVDHATPQAKAIPSLNWQEQPQDRKILVKIPFRMQ